ncbi:MAG: type II secretion system F family protein [Elusimicrobia bacterium]|nr:type II secretion system F family protein [Elusimicrobiota bacterium]
MMIRVFAVLFALCPVLRAQDQQQPDAKAESKQTESICLTQGPCCKKNNLSERIDCLAAERLKKTVDATARSWTRANVAMSDIYYAEIIEKNTDPNAKNLWQNVFGLVYKTLDILKKGTFPSQGIGGDGVDIGTLLPYYTETQGQLRNALDQLYVTPGIANSLGGRGRALFPQLELLYQQLEKIRISSSRRDSTSYDAAFESFCSLSRIVWMTLSDIPPAKYSDMVNAYPSNKKDLEEAFKKSGFYIVLIPLIVFVVVFIFTRLKGIGAQEILDSFIERLSERAKTLAYEYNKQFLGVGAGWLLYGPMIISVIFGLLTMNLVVFFLAAFIFVYLLPTEGLKFIKERRRLKIDSQLLDSLILLSDAMKSGLDLVQGLELAVHEMVPPISEEFDLMLKNYKLGMPFEEALKAFDRRVDSDLVSYVVRAIIIQRQTGGNLTKIFDRIVDTIREEGKLKDKINALTAGPRMQSIVISIIPWGMLMILYFFQPEAVGNFFTSLMGIFIILACVFWQTIGLIVIRKMAKIEV